jgi:hypothetical protein
MAIAAITAAELTVGVELADGKRRGRRAAFVAAVLDTVSVETYDLDVARVHGALLPTSVAAAGHVARTTSSSPPLPEPEEERSSPLTWTASSICPRCRSGQRSSSARYRQPKGCRPRPGKGRNRGGVETA